MKAYGARHGIYLDEEAGPPSRVAKVKSKNRRESRRILHKQARNAAKREIRNSY